MGRARRGALGGRVYGQDGVPREIAEAAVICIAAPWFEPDVSHYARVDHFLWTHP